MTEHEQLIRDIKKYGSKARGMTFLLKHLEGKELTSREAIDAHCYHCCGYGEEEDCTIVTCPLYPFAPYSSKKRIKRAKPAYLTEPSKREVKK